jgi:hypothetical protein
VNSLRIKWILYSWWAAIMIVLGFLYADKPVPCVLRARLRAQEAGIAYMRRNVLNCQTSEIFTLRLRELEVRKAAITGDIERQRLHVA